MPLLCWFDHFLVSGAEICQIFRWFFGKFQTPKRRSEINWPLPKLLSINLNLNLSTLYRISGNPQKCHWVPSVQLAQDIRVLKEDFQVPVKLQQKQNYHKSWSNLADTKFKVQSSKLDAISSRCDESRIKNIFCNTNNT